VWWADFSPQVGREQAGERPAVIVGSSLACQLPNGLVIVVPCTSTDRGLPYQPTIDLNGRNGVAMCDQIKSISVDRLLRPHRGQLNSTEVEAIKFALRQMIDVR
jgi:mRNA interferase MazF